MSNNQINNENEKQFDIYRWIKFENNRDKMDDSFYLVDESAFKQKVLELHSEYDRLNAPKKPLTYTYADIILPYRYKDGSVRCTNQTCLCFIPAMRDFYADQENFNMEIAEKYADKVEQDVKDGYIVPFHIAETKGPYGKRLINISPILKDVHAFPYTPYYFDPDNPSKQKEYTGLIMEQLLRDKILEIDPNPEKCMKVAVVDEAKTKTQKFIETLKQSVKDTAQEVKTYLRHRKNAREYEKSLKTKQKSNKNIKTNDKNSPSK